MNFNSPLFFLFITLVITIHYFLSPRFRAGFLLFVSLLFIGYYSSDSLIAVLFFSFFNFYLSKRVDNNRMLYLAGIAVNTFAIILFNNLIFGQKELNFYLSGISFSIENFIVAIGVSFYSLQNIAYLTDIYFKRSVPETSVSNYLLYVSFFPKIFSGPVMLPAEFIPQIKDTTITAEKLTSGFNRLLLGLFKKMVIADRLYPTVNSIFDFNDNYNGLTTLIGIYVFTIQLYFDFSGYTDMAIGISKMLGYDLKENFNLPFRSTSIAEFWRRWHISLINWFTNYIYYPVVFKFRKHKKTAALIGVILTFLISGIWHGIGFTFLAWAGCHALYLSFELLTKRARIKFTERLNSNLVSIVSILIVFHAVCFSNIFFRANSIESAFQLIKNTFTNFFPSDWLSEFTAPLAVGGHQIEQFNLLISFLIPAIVLLFERKINRIANQEKFNILFFTVMILLIMMFGIFNNGSRFIYMQF